MSPSTINHFEIDYLVDTHYDRYEVKKTSAILWKDMLFTDTFMSPSLFLSKKQCTRLIISLQFLLLHLFVNLVNDYCYYSTKFLVITMLWFLLYMN